MDCGWKLTKWYLKRLQKVLIKQYIGMYTLKKLHSVLESHYNHLYGKDVIQNSFWWIRLLKPIIEKDVFKINLYLLIHFLAKTFKKVTRIKLPVGPLIDLQLLLRHDYKKEKKLKWPSQLEESEWEWNKYSPRGRTRGILGQQHPHRSSASCSIHPSWRELSTVSPLTTRDESFPPNWSQSSSDPMSNRIFPNT